MGKAYIEDTRLEGTGKADMQLFSMGSIARLSA
jgi:hypothetical protein